MKVESLLALFHVTSPALPIGAYAYSSGLESLVSLNFVKNSADLKKWLNAQLETSFSYLDLPLLIRLYQSSTKPNDFIKWEQLLLASRETKELKTQEMQLAQSFTNIFKQLAPNPPFFSTYLGGLAHWYQYHSIPESALLIAYCWSFVENQTAAASKLLCIGQSELQRILFGMYSPIISACELAKSVEEAELGASMPSLSFASSLHETQFARMFIS